jgi:Flp pilus assembly protein TadD
MVCLTVRTRKWFRFTGQCVSVFLWAVCFASEAQSENESPAMVFSLQGSATVSRAGNVIPATESMALMPGDEIGVGEPGRVALKLADGSYVRLPSGAKMRFPEEERALGLLAGAMHFFSHSERHPSVVTEHVTAAIRGTEFTVAVDGDGTTVRVLSGSVDGQSRGGEALLRSGQGARFQKGVAPKLFSIVSSERTVQWSLFAPLIGGEEDLSVLERSGDRERRAVQAIRTGDFSGALRELEAVKSEGCSASSVLKGRLLVTLGDAERGEQALLPCESAESSSHVSSEVVGIGAATLSVLRLMQGRAELAEAISRHAAVLAPSVPSVRIARSFSLQDQGNLEEAVAVLGEVNESSDPDLIARQAELLFMFGRVSEARTTLEHLSSRSWYADTVLGFVLMADRSFDQAELAFERATEAESAAGLPHLGLGLLAVHRGNLEGGRAHFERATVLEPSRAIYRSYLGKSYFEADTYEPAEPEYRRAMELDPNDPTPRLYRSFMKLAQNRPVESLRDIEEARDRSQKRSVYRSRFLLDEDAAVQSASLARTYRELGFGERGKIEAISAMVSDYRNASAHRLLSESQSNVFSADNSLSERRIADLFSPLSINVIDSIGSSVSLNEYSSLFERNGWRTGVSSGYDSFDDMGRTGVVTANKSENLVSGFSASGQVRNGLDSSPRFAEGRVGFSLQAQPTWGDRLFIEGRGITGDESDRLENVGVGGGSVSFGGQHRFTPDVTVIFQSTFERGREKLDQFSIDDELLYTLLSGGNQELVDIEALVNTNIKRYTSLWVNEGQLIARTGELTSMLTARSATTQRDDIDLRAIIEDDIGLLDRSDITLESAAPVNLRSELLSYLGAVTVSDSLFLNVGGSYERVEWSGFDEPPFTSDTETRSRVNPKAGIVFVPSKRAMYRIGYGESLGKGVNIDLASIEPTLIGGISQRFNDNPGTFSRNLGTGADLQPWRNGYIGAEWVRRWLQRADSGGEYDLKINFDDLGIEREIQLNDIESTEIDQDLLNTYWYQILNSQWVCGVDYRFAREVEQGFDGSAIRDHRAKGFSRYFLPNGFFFQATSTYRYQGRENSLIVEGDSSRGWLFGAGIGYRLPTRRGVVLAEIDNILGEDLNLDQQRYFQEIVAREPMVKLAVNLNF